MSERDDELRPPLDAEALAAAVGSRWARVSVVAETASTNADLLSDATAPDRAVLVAEHQQAGRGRLDRSWVSPARAGLTFSVLVRPTVAVVHWGWLPLLAGLSLSEAVTEHTHVRAALKWPNDLLVGTGDEPAAYGKAAGVLAQTSGDAVVVGVGLNVSTTAEELPVPGATSLALCGVAAVDRTALLAAILTRLETRYSQWSDCGGDAAACGLADAYRHACATIGQVVSVTGTDGSIVAGTAVGIDESGRLRVEVPGGEQVIGAGDVHHVRPA